MKYGANRAHEMYEVPRSLLEQSNKLERHTAELHALRRKLEANASAFESISARYGSSHVAEALAIIHRRLLRVQHLISSAYSVQIQLNASQKLVR